MSDPFRGEFGVGEIGGGLEGGGGGLEDVNTQLTKTEEVLISIANQLSGLTKSLEGFQPVAKKMADSKFVKSTSNMAKMFKGIAGASPKAFLIEKLFNTLKPLLDLFKPFQVILDLVSALLKVMVGEALGPMFEALQPLYDAFISLMPIFAELGGTIGNLIAAILTPLVEIFVALMPIIEPIIGIIIMLINLAIEPLKAIFDALMPVILPIIDAIINLITLAIEPLEAIFDALMPLIINLVELAFLPLELILGLVGPLLEGLEPIFKLISDVITPIAETIGDFLDEFDLLDIAFIAIEFVVTAVSTAIGILMDWLQGIVGWVAGLQGETLAEQIFGEDIPQWMLDMLGLADIVGGGGVGGGGTPGYISPEEIRGGLQMAEGGIVSHGIYELGEGGSREAVIPLDQWEKSVSAQTALLGAMHDELMISNSLNRQLVKAKEWKRAFG